LVAEYQDFVENVISNTAWNASVVTEQLLHCLKSRHIPPEVVVGIYSQFFFVFTRILPVWVLEVVMKSLGPKLVPAVLLKSK
jgi:hypothetical protein